MPQMPTAQTTTQTTTQPFPRVTDLSDAYPDAPVLAPLFREFGGRPRYSGRVLTVRAPEHNPLVRATLGQPGEGRVLIVDGGGSLNCALLGDQLAQLAVQSGWAGLIVNGCVRDTATLSTLPLGLRALAAHPRRSGKAERGDLNVPVSFGGVTFVPGMTVYADEDGVILLP